MDVLHVSQPYSWGFAVDNKSDLGEVVIRQAVESFGHTRAGLRPFQTELPFLAQIFDQDKYLLSIKDLARLLEKVELLERKRVVVCQEAKRTLVPNCCQDCAIHTPKYSAGHLRICALLDFHLCRSIVWGRPAGTPQFPCSECGRSSGGDA